MNRWSKIVLAIGGTGTLAWIAGGLVGPAAARGPEALAAHAFLVYGATLLWLLADAWILVFLVACARALRRASGAEPAARAAASPRVLGLGAAALALALTQFTVSGALFPGRMDSGLHLALAVAALLLQLAFLWAGARELARLHRLQHELERPA